jgi:hypothetical protein
MMAMKRRWWAAVPFQSGAFELIAKAEEEGFKLAPFIGIACPGVIKSDGSIEKGAQNLPGNWESSKFNLPASVVEAIPQIGEHDTAIVMHNDGVVQGGSVRSWAHRRPGRDRERDLIEAGLNEGADVLALWG